MINRRFLTMGGLAIVTAPPWSRVAQAQTGMKTDLAALIQSEVAAGRMLRTDLATYDVLASIVIDAKSSHGMSHGFDGQGISLRSRITNGAPVIRYQNTGGPNTNDRYLQLRNFTILGNSLDGIVRDGNGVEVYCDTNRRYIYNYVLENINVIGVGGNGIAIRGSVFEGQLLNCWADSCARFGVWFETWAVTAAEGGGWANATSLHWIGGGARKNRLGGVGFNPLSYDAYLSHLDFIDNQGPGVSAPNGLASITNCTLENNCRNGLTSAAIQFADFINITNCTAKTYGPQPALAAGFMTSNRGGSTMIGNMLLYYGSSTPTMRLADLTGTGKLAVIGEGQVNAVPGVTVARV